MQRRDLIKIAGAGGIAAFSSSAVFGHVPTDFDLSMSELVGSASVKTDDRVELLVPEDAANGAVVPVGVISAVPDTLKIFLFVSDHERSNVATLDTSNAMLAPRLSTHLQLENASTITALIQTELGWFSNSATVKKLGESCEK